MNHNQSQKKKVPDWLNSSLWSAPPPPPPPDSTYAAESESPSPTPSPVPPPPPPPPVRTQPNGGRKSDASNSSGPSPFASASASASASPSLSPSPEEIARQAQLLLELSKKVINLREVRRLASMSIPDAPGIRPTVWKLLLGYLPCDRAMWPSELAKKRSQYKHFKEDLLMTPVGHSSSSSSFSSSSPEPRAPHE